MVIIGGGPSITPEQVETARVAHEEGRCRAIAINSAGYLNAQWADVLYAADPRWWEWHKKRPGVAGFTGERCSIQVDNYEHPPGVHVIRNVDHPYHHAGLSEDPCAIRTGFHGGSQALNIATLGGSKFILLLGYDGAPSPEGKSHFHDGHPVPTSAAAYPQYRASFSAMEHALIALGVRVVNCNLKSWIDTFEKKPIWEFL